jgi:magnesium-transporting ATPase (P-type)
MCENEGIGCFVKRDSEMITIEVCGEQEQYRSLKCFEFDADRKMMTRIVQNIKNGKVTAFCKGADSSILHRCTE